jgi:hypothetical protein
MMKKVAAGQSRYYPGISLEGLKNITTTKLRIAGFPPSICL